MAVIEGLNVAVTKMFAQMPPPEPLPVDVNLDPAEQPWYIRMIMPAPQQQKEVDFSDPKEVNSS